MLKLSFLITYGIICGSATAFRISKHNGKDNIVNIALETVFEFDKENKRNDVNILTKVEKLIARVKNAIETKKVSRRHLGHEKKQIFTDFLVKTIKILNKYEDNDLEKFFLVISNEMKNHHYKGSKFSELYENTNFQKFFTNKLNKIKKKPAADIRRHLGTLASKFGVGKYGNNEKKLWNTINSMYQEDSIVKLNHFLANIDDYRLKARKNIDLQKIVSEGLKSTLFNQYSNLDISMRSALMTQLQNYVQYYYNNIIQNIVNYTTSTKKTSEIRIEKPKPVEKSLNLRQLKHNYDKWIEELKSKTRSSTFMTRRPHSVAITKKIKSRITSNNDKQSNEIKSNVYKKRYHKTTDKFRTLRQMYVEKNIDLKYDPDAYENLTTNIKQNTKTDKTYTSSTTRLPKKNSYKETYKSQSLLRPKQSKHGQEHNTPSSDESMTSDDKDSEVEDFHSKFNSEQQTSSMYTKIPTFRITKMARQFGKTFINKYLEYNDNFEPEYRNKNKTNTLFPINTNTFIIEWTTKKSRDSKINFTKYKQQYKMRAVNNDESNDIELYTFKPIYPNVIEISNEIDYSIDIKKGSDLDLSDLIPEVKNSRYKKGHNRTNNSVTYKNHPPTTSRLKSTNVPEFRGQNRESTRTKLKTSRKRPISSRHYDNLHSGRKQYRRLYTIAPLTSHECLSKEGLSCVNPKNNYRRNNDPDMTETVDSNNYVLGRIQKLESEMDLVKTQIKNDTNMKDFSNNKKETSITYSDNRSVRKLWESTYGTNRGPNFNIDNITGLINADEFNTQKQNTYENMINEQQLNLNEEKPIIDPKESVNEFKTFLKNTTKEDNLLLKSIKDSKEVPAFDFNKTDQGRKSFTNLKQMEITQLGKEKLYNIKAINSASLIKGASKKVSTEKVIYFKVNKGTNKIIFNVTQTMNNKYSSKVTPFENDTFKDDKLDKSTVVAVTSELQFKKKKNDIPVKLNEFEVNVKEKVATIELQPNSTKESGNYQNIDYSGIAFRGRIDETEVLQNETLEESGRVANKDSLLKANDEFNKNGTDIIHKTLQVIQTTKSNLSDSIATTSKLLKELVKKSGGQLANLSNANINKKEWNGETYKSKEAFNVHLVLKA